MLNAEQMNQITREAIAAEEAAYHKRVEAVIDRKVSPKLEAAARRGSYFTIVKLNNTDREYLFSISDILIEAGYEIKATEDGCLEVMW